MFFCSHVHCCNCPSFLRTSHSIYVCNLNLLLGWQNQLPSTVSQYFNSFDHNYWCTKSKVFVHLVRSFGSTSILQSSVCWVAHHLSTTGSHPFGETLPLVLLKGIGHILRSFIDFTWFHEIVSAFCMSALQHLTHLTPWHGLSIPYKVQLHITTPTTTLQLPALASLATDVSLASTQNTFVLTEVPRDL